MTQQTTQKEEPVWSGYPSHLTNFGAYVLSVIGGVVAIVVTVMVARWQELSVGHALLLGVILVAIPVIYMVWKRALVKATHYELTTQRILVTRGIFSRDTESMELYRVKDLRVHQPFWYRMVGVGNVELDTSDHTSPVFTFRAVHNARGLSDTIRNQVEALRAAKGVREVDMDVEHSEEAPTS